MLEKFNIDDVVLKAYPEIAPQHFYLRRENGEILDYQHNLMDTWEKMLGHPMICIDRQMLIQVLYENLKHKDRVLSSERVVSVDFTDSRAHVTTKDSKVFGGDIVVGADGIRSTVRKEMWREAPTGYFPLGRGIKGPRLGSVDPLTGQGGNGAIESVAHLVNVLLRNLDQTLKGLSEKQLESVFAELQGKHFGHAQHIVKQGSFGVVYRVVEFYAQAVLFEDELPAKSLKGLGSLNKLSPVAFMCALFVIAAGILRLPRSVEELVDVLCSSRRGDASILPAVEFMTNTAALIALAHLSLENAKGVLPITAAGYILPVAVALYRQDANSINVWRNAPILCFMLARSLSVFGMQS
ncbi:hypothetical protein Landi51_03256 [Colletotrichum acutatum]